MAAARTWRSRAAARGGSVRMRGRRRRDHGREASGAERGPGGERRPAVAGRGRARLMDWRRSWRTADRAWRRWILNCKGRSSVLKEEKELSVLRKENRQNAALAVAVGLLIALIYACWTM
ncbi:coiled-coil domain-containing protein 167 isoform X4 [Pogoniulus pusillus]|uniref:coiled-coil domain-containing protein 167 isoform X4 n=1 Tax=Pogoniulus pusillus TaxID=488313 RepID=UPI0030B99A09